MVLGLDYSFHSWVKYILTAILNRLPSPLLL